MGDREEQMFRRWEEREIFNNDNNNNNNNYNNNNNNQPNVYPNNGSRTNFPVPANATNAVMLNNIEDGETIVNFHGEAALGRFYKPNTFKGLQENPISGFKKNPFTRAVIRPGNVRRLTARKPVVAAAEPRKRLTRTQRRRAQRKRAAARALAAAQQQGGRRSVTNKRRSVTNKRRA